MKLRLTGKIKGKDTSITIAGDHTPEALIGMLHRALEPTAIERLEAFGEGLVAAGSLPGDVRVVHGSGPMHATSNMPDMLPIAASATDGEFGASPVNAEIVEASGTEELAASVREEILAAEEEHPPGPAGIRLTMRQKAALVSVYRTGQLPLDTGLDELGNELVVEDKTRGWKLTPVGAFVGQRHGLRVHESIPHEVLSRTPDDNLLDLEWAGRLSS